MTPQIYIGTSGWSYRHWKGPFYPQDLPRGAMLAHYAGRFRAVEINSSFYHLPGEAVLDQWRSVVPAGFVFAAKASGYITHRKKLKDPALTLPPFLRRIDRLGDRLGPVLFQLPPRWRCDVERLAAFLHALDRRHRYAFELRDRSWHCDAVYALLASHGAAFCIYELGGERSPRPLTADLVYLRLHGPGAAYCGSYDRATLEAWAETLAGWAAQGRVVYCFFDNDEAGHAPQNAALLQALLPVAVGAS